jgi:hypothetical protein
MKPILVQISFTIAIAFILTFTLVNTLDTSLKADNINPSLYSVNEKPFGKTYGDWTSDFWKWVISIPQHDNPNLDSTGEKCMVKQSEPNVWYLVPTFGGSAERTCEIPAGKAILFPLLVTECNFLENPELNTESELRTCAKQGQEGGSRTLSAAVDGTELKDLEKYRVESKIFDLTLPENNVFSAPPGNTKAVSDGYWVFLKPLPNGNHEIDFSASLLDPSGVNNYNTQVKYHLVVNNSTNSTISS